MGKHEKPSEEARAAFIGRKAEIDKFLAQLKERTDEHLDLAPEE